MAKFKRKEDEHTSEGLPLVGIDLGSSSFKLLAAEPTDPDHPYGSQLRIVAADLSTRYRCVKKGIIQNTSEASYMIRESLLLLSNRLHIDNLPTAFTLLGGKTMRCIDVTVKRVMGYRGPIKMQLIDEMQKECLTKVDKAPSAQPIASLDARGAEFLVDDEETVYNLEAGHVLTRVQGVYSTFFGSPDLREKVTGSFERAGKSIEQSFARPSALLEALASEQDELVGVAIIDMGSDTTTISVYKGGHFLTTKVAALGGNNITMDIQQLGISAQNAEKLKLRFGSAFMAEEAPKTVRIPNVREGEEPILVKTDFLSTIIVSRLEEIMQPIFAELKKFEDQIGQVYITGGASKMANMVEYVQSHTTLPVAYGSHADWLDEQTEPQFYGPEYSAVVGSLLLGAKFRQEHPGKALPGTKVPSGGKGIMKTLTDLFTQENN